MKTQVIAIIALVVIIGAGVAAHLSAQSRTRAAMSIAGTTEDYNASDDASEGVGQEYANDPNGTQEAMASREEDPPEPLIPDMIGMKPSQVQETLGDRYFQDDYENYVKWMYNSRADDVVNLDIAIVFGKKSGKINGADQIIADHGYSSIEYPAKEIVSKELLSREYDECYIVPVRISQQLLFIWYYRQNSYWVTLMDDGLYDIITTPNNDTGISKKTYKLTQNGIDWQNRKLFSFWQFRGKRTLQYYCDLTSFDCQEDHYIKIK